MRNIQNVNTGKGATIVNFLMKFGIRPMKNNMICQDLHHIPSAMLL